MNTFTAPEILAAGVEELRPIFEPYGFNYVPGEHGGSSGGDFARGVFVARDRKVEFSVRNGLGLVTYTLRGVSIGHEDFLRYAGVWGKHRYPNFGGESIDGFRALAHDLRVFFGDFLSGEGGEFHRIVAEHAANPKRFSGLAALGKT